MALVEPPFKDHDYLMRQGLGMRFLEIEKIVSRMAQELWLRHCTLLHVVNSNIYKLLNIHIVIQKSLTEKDSVLLI